MTKTVLPSWSRSNKGRARLSFSRRDRLDYFIENCGNDFFPSQNDRNFGGRRLGDSRDETGRRLLRLPDWCRSHQNAAHQFVVAAVKWNSTSD